MHPQRGGLLLTRAAHRVSVPVWSSPFSQGTIARVKGGPTGGGSGPAVEVDSDASFDVQGRVRAVAWELREAGQFRVFRAWADRRGEGPNHSELLAAVHALRAARIFGATSLVLRTDNSLVAGVLSRRWTAKQPNIVSLSHRAWFEMRPIYSVAVEWVRTREIRTVDRAAKHMRDLLRERRYLPRASWWESSGPGVDAALKWRTRWERAPRRSHWGQSGTRDRLSRGFDLSGGCKQ